MARPRFNFISEIKSRQGTTHFTEIYTGRSVCSWLIGNLNWQKLSELEAASLVTPFCETEVLNSIKALGHNKTSGLDGFTIKFLKKFWNIF